MAVNSRFIQVHPDALIEWIWDDSFYYADNYSIIRDIQNNVTSFTFSADAVDTTNYNKIPQQLYLIDSLINKYGIADPTKKQFLQESQYSNPQPSHFNKVKIWFPIYYIFPNTTGFFLNISALNYENAVKYNLANYFLDISVAGELNKIINETQPFRLNERLWGKSIEIYVPSVYDEALLRVNNAPQLGSINYNLTNGTLGLSQTSPISIDFRFLTKKATILNETTYLTTPALVATIPQAPEYNNLAVDIEHATIGDYFLINGTYNGSLGDFDVFMNTLSTSGKNSYILYTITVSEDNIPQDPETRYIYQDFYKQQTYRPTFKFTNTVASIRVDMQLINSVDSSTITKSSEIAVVGNQIAKYGNYLSSINVSNAIQPKLYNSKPDTLTLPSMEVLNSHLKRKVNNVKTDIKYIPYPVLTNTYNIVVQDTNKTNINGIYYGFGDMQLVLTPFDNVIKIKVAEQVTSLSIKPFSFPSSNSVVQLVFKSATTELRESLYLESNEVDLSAGLLVFKIPATDQPQLKKIASTNTIFYITITTNGVETAVYDGTFALLQDQPRLSLGTIAADVAPRFLTTTLPNNVSLSNISLPGNLTPKPVVTIGTLISQINNNSLSTIQLKRLS